MASVTTYTDPGASTQEVVVPNGINIPALPFAVCLVGVGSRNKRVVNEPVVRGIVKGEALTPASNSPHTVTLANRATKKLENTTLYRTLNGIRIEVPDSYISFNAAQLTGTVTSTVDLSATGAFGLELDGQEAITLVFHDVPSALTTSLVFTKSGNTMTLTRPSGSFLTDGIRAGATVAIATAEDAGNIGSFTVLTVTATAITFTNASGVANADDDTASVTFSGTGFVGREVHVIYNFSTFSAATMAELAAAVNQGLNASEDLGYGSDYASAASVSSSALRITSPISTPVSDVRVSSAIASDAVTAIFGASVRDADSILVIADAIWNASASWTVDYVKVSDDTDPLEEESNIQRIVSVGSSKGGTNFYEVEDWALTSNEVDWSALAAATLTGVAPSGGTFDISTNDQLVLAVDERESASSGEVDITIDLNGLVPAPLGYANPSSAAAATPAEVRANVNAVLAAHLGPRYKAVASVSSTRIVLTSPTEGKAGSSIRVTAADSNSAHTLIFGGEVEALGTGKVPTNGSTYFVTYDYTRPSSDYNVPFRHFSVESLKAQVGNISVETAGYNPLAIAGEIAFDNGSEIVYTIQIDDATAEGNPTRAQVLAALNGAKTTAGTTEIVVVGEPGTRIDVTTDVIDHLEDQNAPLEKHPRRGFFGLEAGAEIGDRDTVASMVGRATRTLQVSPTSPARGRMFMLAPPQQAGVTRNIVFEDRSEVRVSLDSTYLAVATAARRTSLPGPAETLTRRTITGFNTDDITTPWSPSQRRFMAGQGVCVVTYDAGRFIFLDAITTEGGGGNKDAFKIDSTSYQKDIVTTKVNQAIDANAVGIVPFDLASFILDVKLIIQGVIAKEISNGTIGPYRDKTTGAIRSIDLQRDIKVTQSQSTQTEFSYRYWYYLRYPALRFFGEFSVDSPFFAL